MVDHAFLVISMIWILSAIFSIMSERSASHSTNWKSCIFSASVISISKMLPYSFCSILSTADS